MAAPLYPLFLTALLASLQPSPPGATPAPPPGPPAAGMTTYGSDGTDMALVLGPGTHTIDLDTEGTYDYGEYGWAVVFHYERVEIQTGATVKFKNHPSRAPVVWLVQEDVDIQSGATIDLSGQIATNGSTTVGYAEPGPGGFRGGRSSFSGTADVSSAGFGPGGGKGDPTDTYHYGTSGAFMTLGHVNSDSGTGQRADTYGGPALFQLIGGSGGGAGRNIGNTGTVGGGGGGGGAILIAADGPVTLAGIVRANGGLNITATAAYGHYGSGGEVRIASLTGVDIPSTGEITVDSYSIYGKGRVRIETPGGLPTKSGGIPVETSFGTPQPAFPPNPPRLWVASIGGQATPPQGGLTAGLGFDGEQADMLMFEPGPVDIVVESSDLPLDSLVFLRITRAKAHATVLGPLTLTAGTAVTFTDVDLSKGFSALQARAVLPQL